MFAPSLRVYSLASLVSAVCSRSRSVKDELSVTDTDEAVAVEAEEALCDDDEAPELPVQAAREAANAAAMMIADIFLIIMYTSVCCVFFLL